MMLDTLLDEGWDYHDRESDRLATELEAAGGVGIPLPQLSAFIHLATHTIGQHLHDWPRALALGRRAIEAHRSDTESGDAFARLYVASIMAGDAIGAAQFEMIAFKAASDSLTCLLCMRLLLAETLVEAGQRAEGGGLFADALAIASRGQASQRLERRIATTGNNIAWTLHGLDSRLADDDALMDVAAQASLAAWRRCGDWINVELALYLNARVAYKKGDVNAALILSAEGLQVIDANGKRPYDSALFHLLRTASYSALGKVDERAYALAQADAAAKDIAFEALRDKFSAARLVAVKTAGSKSS